MYHAVLYKLNHSMSIFRDMSRRLFFTFLALFYCVWHRSDSAEKPAFIMRYLY